MTFPMLNEKQDAYGHQPYDCFRGDNVVEVVERDEGFIDSSTSLPKYYLADYKNWRPHEKMQCDTQVGEYSISDVAVEESRSIFKGKASTSLE